MTTLDPQRLKEAGALIRDHRGDRTQRSLAAQCGLSLQRYQALEAGRVGGQPVNATVDMYETVALAVGLDPYELLTCLGVETPSPNESIENMTNPTLGQALRRRRTVDLKGISLRDLAAGSGLSHATLFSYEKDRSLPSDHSLPLVARAYRIPVGDFRQMVADARTSQVDVRLPDRYKELSPRAWKVLLNQAEMLLDLQRRGLTEGDDTPSE